MSRIKSKTNIVVVPKKGFTEKKVKSFEGRLKGQIVQGLVIFKGNRFFAYQNLCKHLPVTLDLNDDNFFTHDQGHFQCHMHGAQFELETGFCIAGPCQGARLNIFEIQEEETRLVIRIPDDAYIEG